MAALTKLAMVGLEKDSVVKSTCYSSKGPVLGSQHPHGSSQSFVTPVSGNPTSSSGLLEY